MRCLCFQFSPSSLLFAKKYSKSIFSKFRIFIVTLMPYIFKTPIYQGFSARSKCTLFLPILHYLSLPLLSPKHSKSGSRASGSWVRIPPCPPRRGESYGFAVFVWKRLHFADCRSFFPKSYAFRDTLICGFAYFCEPAFTLCFLPNFALNLSIIRYRTVYSSSLLLRKPYPHNQVENKYLPLSHNRCDRVSFEFVSYLHRFSALCSLPCVCNRKALNFGYCFSW